MHCHPDNCEHCPFYDCPSIPELMEPSSKELMISQPQRTQPEYGPFIEHITIHDVEWYQPAF